MKIKEKLIIEGETGSGKTYFALNKAKKLGTFVYMGPCRQLVYETAIKYGRKTDFISTGEIKINRETKGSNAFCVYESEVDMSIYDTLIIDEAHFITDYERGPRITSLIKKFKGNIFLVTATRNFRKLRGFELIELKSLHKFTKKKVNYDEWEQRMEAGAPSIVFHKYKDNCGEYGGAPITSDTPPDVRLATQIAFAKGEIKLVECTNVLAQGLNFPCENVLIEYNDWDSEELIHQKIGRLGRLGVTNRDSELTYSLLTVPRKIKKNRKIQKGKTYTSLDKQYLINHIVPYLKKVYKGSKTRLKIGEIRKHFLKTPYHAIPNMEYLEEITKYQLEALASFMKKFNIHLFDPDYMGENKYNIYSFHEWKHDKHVRNNMPSDEANIYLQISNIYSSNKRLKNILLNEMEG